jgi:hypothetical protein
MEGRQAAEKVHLTFKQATPGEKLLVDRKEFRLCGTSLAFVSGWLFCWLLR